MYFNNVSHKRKQADLEDERKLSKKRVLEADAEMEFTKGDTDQVSKDPFQLPDPCVANILKYLSGKELLDVMEVCKHWKNTIEGRRAIMNRAMDEVVARFDNGELLGNIGHCVPSKRAFTHMKCSYPSYLIPLLIPFNPIRLLPLALIYAKSLVTLEIECKCLCTLQMDISDMKLLQPITFPNLKSLELYCDDQETFPSFCMKLHRNLVRFIKSCSFPKVSKLFLSLLKEYTCPAHEFDHNLAFNEIVCNMPKLKALSCDMMWANNVQMPQNLPQLEILVTAYVDISTYFHSLKELYIEYYLSGSAFQSILTRLKQLRVLQIGGFGDGQDIYWNEILRFHQHKGMEKFIITDYNDAWDNEREKLQKALPAFPDLKVLVLNCELGSFDTLKFLALNMAKLEKVICKAFYTPFSTSQYFSMLEEENRFANVAIQVEEDYNCCEEEFDFREKLEEFDV